ncbi:MAG: DUF3284 domain-containing protein [Erysipelotrichaceae bacterium]|nr:DUF3284 domain-containing protein [Erysipelotrichaceae bacterium]
MVELTTELKVSAHELYNAIIQQSVMEIKQKTGEDVSAEEIEKNGYKYKVTKKRGKEFYEASINIRKPIADKLFTSSYNSPQGLYEMRYEIEALEEYLCQLHFTQKNGAKDEAKGFWNWYASRKMKSNFRKLADYIISQRDKEQKEG